MKETIEIMESCTIMNDFHKSRRETQCINNECDDEQKTNEQREEQAFLYPL